MKGALAGALGMKSGAELPPPASDPIDLGTGDGDDTEPNELELAAAEEFQQATKTGTPADIVRAFRGLKSACEAGYGDDDED